MSVCAFGGKVWNSEVTEGETFYGSVSVRVTEGDLELRLSRDTSTCHTVDTDLCKWETFWEFRFSNLFILITFREEI